MIFVEREALYPEPHKNNKWGLLFIVTVLVVAMVIIKICS